MTVRVLKSAPVPPVSVRRITHPAGPIIRAPASDHRIVIHASPLTWTRCAATERPFRRTAGDLDVIPAGVTGGFMAEEACDSVEVWVSARFVVRVGLDMGKGAVILDQMHARRDAAMVHLARALELVEGQDQADAFFQETAARALAARLLDVAPIRTATKAGLSLAQMTRIRDFVEATIDKRLTTSMIAREAGASPSHLNQWFREATGRSVHRYVVERRLERARMLLADGDMPLSQVALSAGFSHASHMARWMRRELGVTPSRFQGRGRSSLRRA